MGLFSTLFGNKKEEEDVTAALSPSHLAAGDPQPPSGTTEAIEATFAERQSAARKRADTELGSAGTTALDGMISASTLEVDKGIVTEKPAIAAPAMTALNPETNKDTQAKDSPEPDAETSENTRVPRLSNKGHFVGENRAFTNLVDKFNATNKLELQDANKNKIYETDKALVAPAALLSDEKYRERIDSMLTRAGEKFADKPVRLDGNERFVSTAIDAALARGMTVEVPAKYAHLLEQKEKAVSAEQAEKGIAPAPEKGLDKPEQAPAQATPTEVKELEGVISASNKTVDKTVVTGKLMYATDIQVDGSRILTIKRAGMDVQVPVSGEQFPNGQLKDLMNKQVKYMPAAKDKPAHLRDMSKKKEQTKEQSAALEISM